MINNIKYKKIQDLYRINGITSQGYIKFENSKIAIYKIEPANIIACDEETKYKIYQAYLTCVRGLPDNFQIIISKEKTDFNKQIENCKLRMQGLSNEKLKYALKKYIEYLQEISNVNKLYKSRHYLMVKATDQGELIDVSSIFSNLKEFGMSIERMQNKSDIEKVIKMFMNKGELNGEYRSVSI